jgi:hypothetical protein
MIQMAQPLDDLHQISRNIQARVNDRLAASPDGLGAEAKETHWLMVLREELELGEEEAEVSDHVAPDTYRSGYDQGWVDAIRTIVDARQLLDQAHPKLHRLSVNRHRQPGRSRLAKVS